jgi:hypothetical protein
MRSFELKDAEMLTEYLKKSKRNVRNKDDSTIGRKDLSSSVVANPHTASSNKKGTHVRAKTSIRFYKYQ